MGEQKRTRPIQVTVHDPHLQIPIYIDKERLKTQLFYHNIYRQLKPARKKYSLSCSEIVTLNGVYLYSMLVSQDFTETTILKFVKYYNTGRMKYYFTRLVDRGFIAHHRTSGTHVYYRIDKSGYDLINDMFNEYDAIHAKFINQFNISL